MTYTELEDIADIIKERYIDKTNNEIEKIECLEEDYEIEFDKDNKGAFYIINLGYEDCIKIWLVSEDLIKLYNCICESLIL